MTTLPVRTNLAVTILLALLLASCGAPDPAPVPPPKEVVTRIVPEEVPQMIDPELEIVLLEDLEEAEIAEPFEEADFRCSNLGMSAGGAFAGGCRRGGGVARPAPAAAPEPPEVLQGALRVRSAQGELTAAFPLQHTEVEAEISGFLATTQVRQIFANPYEEVVEAVYLFPLPAEAAVHDFVMEVQDRRIVGLIRRRAEAERIYAAARARGHTASLLTQERPNLFRQSVANIEPGGTVDVKITYVHTLPYEHGEFSYVFPMVVGPRYIPGSPRPPAATQGGGTSPDTDQVPDASRITSPTLRPGQRSGHDIAVRIDLDAGVPLQEVAVPTHQVSIRRLGEHRARIELDQQDRIPNRDLVVRYRIAGDQVQPGCLAHRSDAHGGFFTMLLVPPVEPADAQVTPREVTFIMDVSGSMSGLPLEMSKEVVRRTLTTLRPQDRFNIVYFASGSGSLAPGPVEHTEANVERGLAYLDALQGGGGTEMLSGLRTYLATEQDPRYLRLVCFLTDGFVGNEDAILTVIKERGQDSRWFALGIGSSVNRHLIDGIAERGRGVAQVVLSRDRAFAERAVTRFFSHIDSPVLVDLVIDTGDLPVTDLEPAQVHDLFAGQPLQLTGRYTGPATGTITVRGRAADRPVELQVMVDLPASAPEHAALPLVWARRRIARLQGEQVGSSDATLEEQITQLALEFHLASKYTSFVAVDESRVVGDGQPIRVLQPLELPEGVSYEGAVGADPVGVPLQVPAWGVVLVEQAGGDLLVSEVTAGGPAATQGVTAGDRLVTAARTQVRGLRHLESLLVQHPGVGVELGIRPGDPADQPLRQVTLALR
jgi:Ca-activated chloride channel family protein